MNSIRLVLIAVVAGLCTLGQARADTPPDKSPPASAAPSSDAAYPLSAFAAIGSSFTEGNHLPELGWSDAQIEAFIDGVRASFHGKGYPFDDAARQVSAVMGHRVEAIMSHQMQQAFADPAQMNAYLKDISKRLNLDQSDSGLCYGIQAGGHGNRPGPDDTVVISCVAMAADGTTKLPQLSYENSRIKVSSLLPGIREGIQMMTNSSQAIFVLPPSLSFGSGEWPQGVVPGSPLIFQITLHEVAAVSKP